MKEVLRVKLSHDLTAFHVTYKLEYVILSPLTFFFIQKRRDIKKRDNFLLNISSTNILVQIFFFTFFPSFYSTLSHSSWCTNVAEAEFII